MGCESLDFFINKNVRLVKSDGFVLTGKILRVSDKKILFETNQATSLISLGNIKEIVAKNKGGVE
jgi:hypothetical protein